MTVAFGSANAALGAQKLRINVDSHAGRESRARDFGAVSPEAAFGIGSAQTKNGVSGITPFKFLSW
ncbi:hypothetical protein GCM10023156_60580 [Novipirellula rosea]|uniref:Uncharacterized protein n=1 Tax=Novipirellula rosea TaxID=1031540 RepID=A0ABP8NLP0_9BACT